MVNRLWKTFGIILLCTWLANAQTGSEWINHDQEYYRIKIAEDGVYRVTAGELASAGVPVNNIAEGRYQLFRRGEEVAILVNDDDNDGRLNHLEFYGERNDGKSDTDLYVSAEAQPHTYYNLFSDTATYFLTWYITDQQGKRMEFSSLQGTTGFTPEPYHYESLLTLQTSSYNPGIRYGGSQDLLSALYDFGEGWTGGNISKNRSQDFTFELSDFDNSGSAPTLELVLTGISSFEHVVDVSVGSDEANLRSVGEVTFNGRLAQFFQTGLDWGDVGNDGTLMVRATALGLPGQTDVVTVSYVKVDYARDFTFSDTRQTFRINSSGASRGYIVLPTSQSASLRVFDITDPAAVKTVAATAYSDRLEFVFPDLTIDRELHVINEPGTVADISVAEISQLPTGAANYLIVSHPVMDQEVDGVNPVSAYGDYRSSATGGGYDVLQVDIRQIFDQFGYGDSSPMALRNFVKRCVLDGDPEHLFIIGKGTTPNYDYYRQPEPNSLDHFVPTFGFPGADMPYSTHIINGNKEPLVTTGRLNATSSGHVKTYLDKVKEMEATPFDELWRKNLIQLSGGQTTSELQAFKNFIFNFKALAEGDYLGGKAFNVHKSSTDAVELINVADEVNRGVGLITFFGHSSSIVTDIEIGRASDPAAGYNNAGKYPMMLVNGCNAGGIFGTTLTFGEDWIRTPNAGAIGVMANSDFALSSSLKRWSDLFYQVAFTDDELFGSSVGVIVNEVANRYFTLYGTGGASLSQVYQTVLQGDPAAKVFGAERPDYALESSETFATAFNQDRVLSNADSFQVNLVIKNFGRSVKDSLEISIARTLPDGTQENYLQRFQRVLRQDTLALTLYNDQEMTNEGTNTFIIQLDPENKVPELNENNNSATFELFIPRGNTIPLFPADYAVVGDRNLTLLWQSANQLEQTRDYSLEVDTSALFGSPFLTSSTVQADLLARHVLNLNSLPDSTTVYWRTRFTEARANEDTSWVTQSFTLIEERTSGWAQLGGYQFTENRLVGVNYDPEQRFLDFKETQVPVQVNTHGVGSSNAYENYQVIIDGVNFLITDNAADPRCKKLNAINAVVFDKESAQPYRPFGVTGADVFNDLVCGRLPQMIYNFNENDVLGSNRYLDSLISVMQNGDMILLFSFDSVAFSNWDAQLQSSLNEIGVETSTINGLTDGQPVVFLGKKGEPAGSALTVTSDGSAIPIKEQTIELVGQVTGKFVSGILTSTRIGPATDWSQFHYQVAAEANDFWGFNVTGISPSGEEEVVFSGDRSTDIDISELDASQYPYLSLNFDFSDPTDQTPPQLLAWGVDYALPPEGILAPVQYETLEINEGDNFAEPYLFTNISNIPFDDSLNVEATFTRVETGNRESQVFNIAAPAPGDTTRFDVSTNTRGRAGSNNVLTKVTAPQLEQLTVNNVVNRTNAFTVLPDETNPVLDVTFDGGYILDGDIVSPTPRILIRFKDENEFLFKDDTTGINIELKAPCEECVFQRVSFANPEVTYTPASESQPFEISYEPGPLADGVYQMRVQGTDESGNQSGEHPYEVSFEVINESTITHFYPYPNPFSTQTRFVFTLTGSTIPDRIKIQIMTVSGRVVREITQNEIGQPRIGNNITDYAWDGRDEFGDQLANGVYLYKVFIQQDGQQIKHRNTNADRAFKNGFGKIYLLR